MSICEIIITDCQICNGSFGNKTNGHYNCNVKRKIYREDIIQAGTDLMFEHGYNATGIKDITDRIEIPKGSFYNHFSSKEEFGLEVMNAYITNGYQWHKKSLLDSNLSPKQRLISFYENMIDGYSNVNDFRLGCMMSNMSAEMADINEKFRKELDKGFDEQQSVIRKCLDEALEGGEIAQDMDTELYSASLLNGWHGALVRMKSTGDEKPLQDFKKFFIDSL